MAVVAVLLVACVMPTGAHASTPPLLSASAASLDAGGSFACAVGADSTPVCWGNNSVGQATVPPDIGPVTQIATGGSHACAIKADGTPVCWGNNADDRATVPAGTGTVTQIAAGTANTCVIKTDGTGRCWGRNLFGETAVPAALGTITQISAGGAHTCAIKTSGAPACWGYGPYVSSMPGGIGTVTDISAGGGNTCVVKTNGSPVCWGDGDVGTNDIPSDIGKVTTVAVGLVTACAIKVDGAPLCWGGEDPSYGYNYGQMNIPAGTGTVTEITGGDYFTCAIKTDATTACWGRNEANQTVEPAGTFAHTTLDAGDRHTCAVRTGSAACWTRNLNGESTVPATVGTVTRVAAAAEHSCAIRTSALPVCWGSAVPAPAVPVTRLATGDHHRCALNTDGTPTCWGDNAEGQLTLPAGIGTLTAVSAGALHSCAIKTDGTPVCWGSDGSGQSTVPAGIGTVTAIAAGTGHSCAIKTDGMPTCWGDDTFGQATVPTGPAASTVTAIAAGASFTCAIRTDGTPQCWGHNGSGPAIVPADVGTVTEITAGIGYACATKTDGFVACWGNTPFFELPSAAVFSAAAPTFAGGAPYAFNTVATAARPGATYAVSAGALPAGLTVNPSTGVIGGTATVAGTFGVTIRASNGIVPSSSRAYTIPVELDAPTTTDDVDAAWHPAPVVVTLTAADTGGAGLNRTHYEKGASPAAPTTSSPVYNPASKPVLGDGERIRYFSVDRAGNAEAARASLAAKVDPAVPETTIDTPPAPVARNQQPTIAFSTGAPDATFTCTLDAGAPATPCTSPFVPPSALGDGAHTFTVTAISRAGIGDPTPATAQFVVDTVAPAAPTFTAAPPATSTQTSATFAFTGEPNASFACALDAAPATPCTSPLMHTALAIGAHTLRVTQTDRAGNTSPAASRGFAVRAALTPQSLTLTLAGRGSQLLVDKPRIAISVGCAGVACRLEIRGRVALRGQRAVRLRTVTAQLPAGQLRKRLHVPTTKRQRAAIRRLARTARTARVRLTFDITATAPDGTSASRTVTIALRELERR